MNIEFGVQCESVALIPILAITAITVVEGLPYASAGMIMRFFLLTWGVVRLVSQLKDARITRAINPTIATGRRAHNKATINGFDGEAFVNEAIP